jgi:enoyl-CoA hydratase
LTGRFFSAEEAERWGFVNRVVPPEHLLSEAQDMARQMLAGVPGTLVAYKRLLDDEAGVTFNEAIRMERAASVKHNSAVSRADIETRLDRLRHKGR